MSLVIVSLGIRFPGYPSSSTFVYTFLDLATVGCVSSRLKLYEILDREVLQAVVSNQSFTVTTIVAVWYDAFPLPGPPNAKKSTGLRWNDCG